MRSSGLDLSKFQALVQIVNFSKIRLSLGMLSKVDSEIAISYLLSAALPRMNKESKMCLKLNKPKKANML